MQELAAQAWNPVIAWLVLGAGAVLLLVTLVAPLRALPRAVQSLRGRTVSESGDGPLWLPLAAATGMGSIVGGVLAMATGGPGALVWMWIATVLGMAIAFAEASLSARARDDREPATVHLLPAPVLGRLLAPMFAIAVLAMAVIVGGPSQTHQAAALLGLTHELPPLGVAIGLAVAAAPFVLRPTLRRPLLLAVPVALVIFVILALTTAGREPLLGLHLGDAFNQAFGIAPVAGGAVGGGVALALAHGVLRATLAGQAGLGTVALLDLRARSRGAAGAVAMLVPLVASGVVGTASALLLLGAPATGEPVAGPTLRPMELAHARGLRPSLSLGQTIVLPVDTPMEAGKFYGMRMRSDPRGHALATLVEEQNHVALPHWVIAHASDTIVFRARGEERRKHGGWDVRIPAEREVKTSGGLEYVLLRPKDPELDLKKLVTKLELLSQPYVPFDDFTFTGLVGRATNPDPALGEHLAMIEAPSAERPFNPEFHLFFRAENTAFRGPYADDDGPQPPWAFVANEGWEPEIGSTVPLRIVGDPRGDAVVRTTRSGSLEAPPWDILLGAKTLVLRHETDATKDLRLPVTPRYELYRVRLTVDDARFVNENGVLKPIEGYEKEPYLVVPDYEFEAEVHGDARLPAELKGRRTLVPLHPLPEPQGPFGDGETYHPHPAELLEFGMHGPLPPAREGAELVAARLRPALGGAGRFGLALSVVVLALAALVAWAELGGRAATAVLGSMGRPVLELGVLVAAGLGTLWTFEQLLPTVDLVLAAVLLPNLVGLLLLLPKVRQAARLQDDLDAGAGEARGKDQPGD